MMGKLADALNEKSKRDDALIVGSDIRGALQEQSDEIRQKDEALRFIARSGNSHTAAQLAGHARVALESVSDSQPRTRCNKHGWWDYGPCPHCREKRIERPLPKGFSGGL